MYKGEVLQCVRNGQGTYQYPHGGRELFVYTGRWQDGIKQDESGIFQIQGYSEFKGHFVDGEINGLGKRIWNDGREYDGEWLYGEMHGKGCWKNPKLNEEYIGEFENNKRHGFGTLKKNGDNQIYEGHFRAHKFHGNGSFVLKDVMILKGKFENNILEGNAEVIWEKLATMSAFFASGYPVGVGHFLTYDGSYKFQGLIERNELLRSLCSASISISLNRVGLEIVQYLNVLNSILNAAANDSANAANKGVNSKNAKNKKSNPNPSKATKGADKSGGLPDISAVVYPGFSLGLVDVRLGTESHLHMIKKEVPDPPHEKDKKTNKANPDASTAPKSQSKSVFPLYAVPAEWKRRVMLRIRPVTLPLHDDSASVVSSSSTAKGADKLLSPPVVLKVTESMLGDPVRLWHRMPSLEDVSSAKCRFPPTSTVLMADACQSPEVIGMKEIVEKTESANGIGAVIPGSNSDGTNINLKELAESFVNDRSQSSWSNPAFLENLFHRPTHSKAKNHDLTGPAHHHDPVRQKPSPELKLIAASSTHPTLPSADKANPRTVHQILAAKDPSPALVDYTFNRMDSVSSYPVSPHDVYSAVLFHHKPDSSVPPADSLQREAIDGQLYRDHEARTSHSSSGLSIVFDFHLDEEKCMQEHIQREKLRMTLSRTDLTTGNTVVRYKSLEIPLLRLSKQSPFCDLDSKEFEWVLIVPAINVSRYIHMQRVQRGQKGGTAAASEEAPPVLPPSATGSVIHEEELRSAASAEMDGNGLKPSLNPFLQSERNGLETQYNELKMRYSGTSTKWLNCFFELRSIVTQTKRKASTVMNLSQAVRLDRAAAGLETDPPFDWAVESSDSIDQFEPQSSTEVTVCGRWNAFSSPHPIILPNHSLEYLDSTEEIWNDTAEFEFDPNFWHSIAIKLSSHPFVDSETMDADPLTVPGSRAVPAVSPFSLVLDGSEKPLRRPPSPQSMSVVPAVQSVPVPFEASTVLPSKVFLPEDASIDSQSKNSLSGQDFEEETRLHDMEATEINTNNPDEGARRDTATAMDSLGVSITSLVHDWFQIPFIENKDLTDYYTQIRRKQEALEEERLRLELELKAKAEAEAAMHAPAAATTVKAKVPLNKTGSMDSVQSVNSHATNKSGGAKAHNPSVDPNATKLGRSSSQANGVMETPNKDEHGRSPGQHPKDEYEVFRVVLCGQTFAGRIKGVAFQSDSDDQTQYEDVTNCYANWRTAFYDYQVSPDGWGKPEPDEETGIPFAANMASASHSTFYSRMKSPNRDGSGCPPFYSETTTVPIDLFCGSGEVGQDRIKLPLDVSEGLYVLEVSDGVLEGCCLEENSDTGPHPSDGHSSSHPHEDASHHREVTDLPSTEQQSVMELSKKTRWIRKLRTYYEMMIKVENVPSDPNN